MTSRLAVYNHTCGLSHGFRGSGVQAWISWGLCFWNSRKVCGQGLRTRVKIWGRIHFRTQVVSAEFSLWRVVGLRASAPCWRVARGGFQLLTRHRQSRWRDPVTSAILQRLGQATGPVHTREAGVPQGREHEEARATGARRGLCPPETGR